MVKALRTSVRGGGLRQGGLQPGIGSDNIFATASLDLDFARHKNLGQQVDATTGSNLVDFTRASSGTYVGSDGLIKTATTNEARFDHDPTTGESLGLLVEESRTNLLTYSEEFDNAAWTKTGSSGSANAITAPNGLVTADKLVEDNSTGSHFARQDVSTTAAVRTASIYLKAGERSLLRIEHIGNTGNAGRRITVDLAAGSITAASTIGSGGLTFADQSIVSVGNGWYRFISTIEPSTTTGNTASLLVVLLDAGGNSSYTGDGTSGIYVWGAQLEAGSFPTSYIPTTSSTVTRADDVASIEGANFSSWYRQEEGSFFWEGKIYANQEVARQVPFRVTEGSSLRGIGPQIDTRESNKDIFFNTRSDAGNTQITLADTFDETNLLKIAGTFSSDVAGSFNGSDVITDSPSYIFESEDRMEIMGYRAISGSNAPFNGHTRRITYWPTRLGNDTLQTITQ